MIEDATTVIPFQLGLYTRAVGILVFSSHGVHRMVVITRLCREGKKWPERESNRIRVSLYLVRVC